MFSTLCLLLHILIFVFFSFVYFHIILLFFVLVSCFCARTYCNCIKWIHVYCFIIQYIYSKYLKHIPLPKECKHSLSHISPYQEEACIINWINRQILCYINLIIQNNRTAERQMRQHSSFIYLIFPQILSGFYLLWAKELQHKAKRRRCFTWPIKRHPDSAWSSPSFPSHKAHKSSAFRVQYSQ